MNYLGLGKTLFNSSACLLRETKGRPEIELVLSERILRKKASGAWPEQAIRRLEQRLGGGPTRISESRDVLTPLQGEEALDRAFPFFDYLRERGLQRYSRRFNPEVEFVTHHRCHAMAAVAMCPFEKCLIVVMDGAGSKLGDFPPGSPESGIGSAGIPPEAHEECSVYLQDQGRLRCVYKRWRSFHRSRAWPEQVFSEGVGILYEKAAEYIFNSGRAAGKVMGLAPFGRPGSIRHRLQFLEGLDWNDAFVGKGRKEWESCGRQALFADLAATVQAEFEEDFFQLLASLRERFPAYDRIVLTGGCALNCTANGKLLSKGLFREVYVPPFPGDECIALGAASELFYGEGGNAWHPWPHEEQQGYFGPCESLPAEDVVRKSFAGFSIEKPPSIVERAAGLLAEGHILGWFQGRSESGPRALGNRSILANPEMKGLKERLNREIKFRESFRPYGASCLHGDADRYFEVPKGFNNPYMSFAVRTRAEHRARLGEVTHVDGTSRMQTVRPGQNPRFHGLIQAFGARTGLFCLLNTSLNVMGEPIVESVEDARKFLESVPVHGLAIGDFYIRKEAASAR